MLTILAMVLAPSLCMAQGETVFVSYRSMIWEHDSAQWAAIGGVYHMYCQADDPGVYPDPTKRVGTIAAPDVVWNINLPTETPNAPPNEGNWHCIVTAVNPNDGFESLPSNELELTVIEITPGNLRLASVSAMLEDPLWYLGEAALASSGL